MLLVQRLREIQDRHGYLPDDALLQLSKDTTVPLPRIQEVVSFFAHFRPEWDKPKRVEVHVCRDMTCHLKGAPKVLAALQQIEHANRETCHVAGVSCLGRCDRAPAVVVSRHPEPNVDHRHESYEPLPTAAIDPAHNNPFAEGDRRGSFHEWVYAGRTADDYAGVVQTALAGGEMPVPDWDWTYALHTNDWQIDPYPTEDDWYGAVRAVVKDLPNPLLFVLAPQPPKGTPEREKQKIEAKFHADRHPWLERLQASGLLGMGGAGMKAYTKWFEVWKQDLEDRGEKYIVCNGDESEPGTFKDRELLLQKPHLVVEGVILAGLLTNATRGFIFIRHEYTEQVKAVRAAVADAVRRNACGPKIFGSNRTFSVEVFVSPGGYICGEQTALIEAMEDHRAQPRNRPPELMTNGLRDKPTVVNNVETLAWTPRIMVSGGEWYKRGGDEDPKASEGKATAGRPGPPSACEHFPEQSRADKEFVGRRLISISGDLRRPGVYEVEVGDTLQKVINDYAGGCTGKLKAVCTSGPSGGILPFGLTVASRFVERLRAAFDAIDENEDGLKLRRLLLKLVRGGLRDPDDPDRRLELPDELGACLARLQELEDARRRLVFHVWKLPLDLNQFKTISKLLGVGMGRHGDMMLGPSMGKSAGMMLGAGIVVYSSEGAPNMLDHAVNHTEFFRNESCGKCVPCRLGSQKLVEIGTDLLARSKAGTLTKANRPDGRAGLAQQAGLVSDMSLAMVMTSICSLGQVAPNPLMTVLQYFPHEIKTAE